MIDDSDLRERGDDRPRIDDGALSLDDAVILVNEIERLRAALARSEARLIELDRLAHRDSLLDVPNRRSFLANLQRVVARVQRYSDAAAVLFVDVDGLKAINDKFGHQAGDEALLQVARQLVASVRSADLVGRLAGDEFGIVLEHSDELAAWQTALRIIEAVDEAPFCIGQVCLPLSVAIGVAIVRPGDTPESVIARADTSMYQMKRVQSPLLGMGSK